MLAIALCITALARPRGHIGYEEVTREGIDIVMAMDISVSMLAEDFDTNRLYIAKKMAKEFIDGRPDDRFGLVAFSGESVTRSPLTSDRSRVKKKIDELKTGILPDGTAIGMGLATSVARLKNSEAKSKVVILLTDGENNAGVISPVTAAELAQVFGVRVYTIGVGTIGRAYSPVARKPNGEYIFDYVDVRIDEPMLQKLAEMTGGKYFRAVDESGLRKIYQEIDQLEKTKIKVTEYRNKPDRFFWFVALAGFLFLVEYILRLLVYRTIP
jgi:Ca-activated chloride channel family protein